MSGINSNFEKDFILHFTPLEERIKRIENKLQNVMYRSLSNARISNVYWESIRKELDVLYKELNEVFAKWTIDSIPLRYRKSLRNMQKHIVRSKSIFNQARKSIPQILRTTASSNLTRALWEDAVLSFFSAAENGRRNMYRLTRLTQQTLINESFIDIEIAKAIDAGDLRIATRKLNKMFSDRLWQAVDNKQFVEVNGRKYKPSYYAEMVTRTKYHEAQSQAALTMANNYDTDLVIVSSHNTTTEICQQYEGKIYSISGKDKRFPILGEAPPFHPNCLHLLFPQFVSSMEAQRTLSGFSDFSLGKINKPPHPAGFIPVLNRKVS